MIWLFACKTAPLLAVGDSITAGSMSDGATWPAAVADLLGRPVENRSRPGAPIAEIAAFAAGARGPVLLLGGANDCVRGEAWCRAEIRASLRSTDVVVLTYAVPLAGGPAGEVLALTNRVLRDEAAAAGRRLLDVEPCMAEAQASIQVFAPDGLHLGRAGQGAYGGCVAQLW